MTDTNGVVTLHATAVAIGGHAALIRGASGRGKSGLALQLIGLGCALVSDDRTLLWREADRLLVDAPAAIRGRIEARGVGILNAPAAGPHPVALVIDMDAPRPARLPEPEQEAYLGVSVPLVRASAAAHFPAAIYLYLLHGRFA
ncbi:HPr kinase/phosphorylase [Roseovarius dicentrarchi]|uniref:HPr kinase/phosphorylase n=1 Tax=Roseovarius dicentrarchi TaxID=2250573 RepID=UPI001EF0737D|nr:HPr kinase/phosphatase C-terminal domain-containing protein [Roseovarius dicentrarchi]